MLNPTELAPLFAALVARAVIDPPTGSRPLYLGDRQCGWLAADVPALCEGPPAFFTQHPAGWAIAPHASGVDAGLAALATHLHGEGRLRGWRNELLDVTDLSGCVIGRIERGAVRPLGIATRAVHLNAWTPDGRLWLAKRALTKSTDPGMWDTLVGGLVSAGEGDSLALERESWEEAGLPPATLTGADAVGEYCVRRVLPEGYQVEWVGVYDVVLPPDVTPCNQDGEVDEIRTATPQEVVALLREDAFTLEAALALGLVFARRGWLDAGVLAPVTQRQA